MPDLWHEDASLGRCAVTFDGRILGPEQWPAVEPFVREVAAAVA